MMDRRSPHPAAQKAEDNKDKGQEQSPSEELAATDVSLQNQNSRPDKEAYRDEKKDGDGPLRKGAGDFPAFQETTKEIVRFWWKHFPTGVVLHLRSPSFRINAAVIALLLVCDPGPNLLFVWLYGFGLFLYLSAGIHGFYMCPKWRQQGSPVRSPQEMDEAMADVIGRLAKGRLWIALMADALLLLDWQVPGAYSTIAGFLGMLLQSIAGTQMIVSTLHSISWQTLFNAETGALKGGRS